MIMFSMCVQALRMEAACLPLVNQRSTVTVLPSSLNCRSMGKWDRSSFSSPRGPLIVTCRVLIAMVTPSGILTVFELRMVFCEHAWATRTAP